MLRHVSTLTLGHLQGAFLHICSLYFILCIRNSTHDSNYIGCPTRYRNRHFFNNFTTGWRTAAPCRNN
jgi:hypothetical protein